MFFVAALLPFVSIAIFALGKLGVPSYLDFFGAIDAFSILRYAHYFAFGGLLAADAELIERFSASNPLWGVLTVSVAVLVSGWLDSTSGLISRALSMYLTVLISWFSVLICFAFFRSFCNQQSLGMAVLIRCVLYRLFIPSSDLRWVSVRSAQWIFFS